MANCFYSDYDLKSLLNFDTMTPAFSERLRHWMNEKLGRRMIRHGPLDDYSLAHEIPIKFPIVLFAPNSKPVIALNPADTRGL